MGRLGVSFGGWNSAFPGDFAEAESEKNEEREGSSEGAGEWRDEMVVLVVNQG